MIRLQASTIVEIKGAAMIAGSRFRSLAAMGSVQPMLFAMMTVIYRLKTTVRHTIGCPGYISIRRI